MSNIKMIKKLSKTMPQTLDEFTHRVTLLGRELIAEGTQSLPDGSKVIPNNKYYKDIPKFRELNHFKLMKKFYKKYGTTFMDKYILWLKDHQNTMVAKYPEMFKKIEDEQHTEQAVSS